MADVFHQIYIQTVFSVKHRQALIAHEWEDDLYKYTTGIVQNRGNKMLAIGGMPDHVHIFIGLKPAETLSDLVAEIKKSTNEFVQTQGFQNSNLIGKRVTGHFHTVVHTVMRFASTY